jgi:glycosyltransferase involved in cell wall biosynthesis
MVKVSVIVPCYNADKYLTKCLQALEKQSYKNFDVYLIDDCSTDGTLALISEYAINSSLAIHCLQNNQNSGPGKSRNYGILESGAEYITFCDSDDWYEEEFLMLMVNAATESDGADIVFCNTFFAYQNGKKKVRRSVKKVSSKNNLLINGIDSLCSMMIKRDLLIATPIPDIRNGEDMAVIPILITNADSFSFVETPIYNYLCRKASLSNAKNSAKVISLLKSFDFIFNNLAEKYAQECEFLGIRNIIYGTLLNLFKNSYDKTKALSILAGFEEKFPTWQRNQYLNELGLIKKVFVKSVSMHSFRAVWILSKLHTLALSFQI